MGNKTMTYTHDEVCNACLDYFDGDEIATNVWMSKYALRSIDNVDLFCELTPHDMHTRLAHEFARVESNYANPLSFEEIIRLFDKFKYVIPQGSPMSAIGNNNQLQSLSNCFVVASPHDSYGGILFTDQEQVQIMKRRGGVGFDISTIRPRGSITDNAARTTDGIGVFMTRYSNTCREVAQGGRRGALMMTLDCFVGETPILTEDGWQSIDSIVNNRYDGRVWTHNGFKEIDAYQRFEDREVYEVECENGRMITVTGHHKFVVYNVQTGEEYLKAIAHIDHNIEELVFYDVTFDVADVDADADAS